MQPNGKPHVLVLHPTSLIIHKAVSEPTQEKKLKKTNNYIQSGKEKISISI